MVRHYSASNSDNLTFNVLHYTKDLIRISNTSLRLNIKYKKARKYVFFGKQIPSKFHELYANQLSPKF